MEVVTQDMNDIESFRVSILIKTYILPPYTNSITYGLLSCKYCFLV